MIKTWWKLGSKVLNLLKRATKNRPKVFLFLLAGQRRQHQKQPKAL
jgi:hypothetical protein